jgi:CheY-like chemotaxis protein
MAIDDCATSQGIDILVVEDNPGDVRLIMEVLKQGTLRSRISVARDGVEAIAFLRRQGAFVDAPRPQLVLLDLNLPRKSGREVLEEIKTDPDLRRIPVIVLTTSAADQDVLRAYDLHANSYINKPVDLKRFKVVIRSIEDFWLSNVRFATT